MRVAALGTVLGIQIPPVAITVVALRALLVGVLVVAGMAKLSDRAGSGRAVVDLGGPRALASVLATLVPLAEIAVAVALLVPLTAWWGALGALALLLVFSAVVGVNLVRGRRPDCRCFGRLHTTRIGWPTLARNGLLAAAAALLIFLEAGLRESGLTFDGVQSGQLTLLLVTAALITAGIWLFLHRSWQNRPLVAEQDASRPPAADAALGGR